MGPKSHTRVIHPNNFTGTWRADNFIKYPHKLGESPKGLPVVLPEGGILDCCLVAIPFSYSPLTKDNILAIKLLSTTGNCSHGKLFL